MAVLDTDDFERLDNADLGAEWTPLSDGNSGGDNFAIVGNAAQSPDVTDSCERQVAATWPNDHWSEGVIGTPNASGQGAGVGVAVRCASPGTITYYRFVVNASGWSLGRFAHGTPATHTEIAGGTGTTWANNDTAYLEVQGTTLIAKKNTTAGAGGTTITTQTDANIASGGAGIAHSTSDITGKLLFWQGGDFSGGIQSGVASAAGVATVSAVGQQVGGPQIQKLFYRRRR